MHVHRTTTTAIALFSLAFVSSVDLLYIGAFWVFYMVLVSHHQVSQDLGNCITLSRDAGTYSVLCLQCVSG